MQDAPLQNCRACAYDLSKIRLSGSSCKVYNGHHDIEQFRLISLLSIPFVNGDDINLVTKYIYIDESGELGLSKMSSKVLIISALIADDSRKLDRIIKNARRYKFSKELRKAKEIKFNKSSRELKEYLIKKLIEGKTNPQR